MAKKEISAQLSAQLQGLVKLISFFKQVRHKDTLESLGFFFVNDLYNLIPYRQCIMWNYRGADVRIVAASGQVNIEKNSPLAQFVRASVRKKVADHELVKNAVARAEHIEENGYAQISDLTPEEVKSFSDSEVKEFISPHMSHILLFTDGGLMGGIMIARDKALGDMERAVLEDTGDALAEKMMHFRGGRKRVDADDGKSKKIKFAVLFAILLFCFWPVRFSVTSYAEVVAKDSTVVTIPFEGLIEDINVRPNEAIEQGDLLFSLDKTRLRNEYALAQQFLDTARERLAKTEREVFTDPKKIPELNLLREEVKLKTLELQYAKERLDVSDVRADLDGIVLFSDKNDLLGKPAAAGDVIMTLAKPEDMELLVKIPAESMINLDWGVPVRFFLNTAPLNSLEADLYNVSYKPTSDPDSLLTYKARAHIMDIEDIKRIGLTGTAKLYGGRTVMIVNLLRRPFVALRNLISF